MDLPPLASLVALDALYRAGSVTAAADLLGRTHGAVSKQLHQLQDHAGHDLLRKQGAGVVLTEEGRAFARSVAAAMEDMRNAYARLVASGEGAPVTIAVSSTFARQWAIPTIARFNLDHPDIEVVIRLVGPHGSREIEQGADLVLSWNRLLSPLGERPSTRTLGDVHIGPVLSPSYPHELRNGRLSVGAIIHRRGAEAAWDHWSELTGIRLDYERALTFDLSSLGFEAASRAMGVAMAPKFLIEDELRKGMLVAPAGFLVFKEGFYVRPYHDRGKLSRNAAVLLDWLAEHGRLTQDGFLAQMPAPTAFPAVNSSQ